MNIFASVRTLLDRYDPYSRRPGVVDTPPICVVLCIHHVVVFLHIPES